eukprot:COSAG06_NODE_42355_length_382_cov_1.155477_1_plen_47_part_10
MRALIEVFRHLYIYIYIYIYITIHLPRQARDNKRKALKTETTRFLAY